MSRVDEVFELAKAIGVRLRREGSRIVVEPQRPVSPTSPAALELAERVGSCRRDVLARLDGPPQPSASVPSPVADAPEATGPPTPSPPVPAPDQADGPSPAKSPQVSPETSQPVSPWVDGTEPCSVCSKPTLRRPPVHVVCTPGGRRIRHVRRPAITPADRLEALLRHGYDVALVDGAVALVGWPAADDDGDIGEVARFIDRGGAALARLVAERAA